MAKNAKKTQQMKHEGLVEILRYFYCSFWLLIAITVYNSYTNPYKPINEIKDVCRLLPPLPTC